MTSRELNKMLLLEFPNLKPLYEEEIGWQEGEDTGSHIVYGDVLSPYLTECVLSNRNTETKKIMEFIEKIANLQDSYADEVILFSVLEGTEILLRNDKHLMSVFGPMTKKLLSYGTD